MESCPCIRTMTAGRGSPAPAREWSVFSSLGLQGEGTPPAQGLSRLGPTHELPSVSEVASYWLRVHLNRREAPRLPRCHAHTQPAGFHLMQCSDSLSSSWIC